DGVREGKRQTRQRRGDEGHRRRAEEGLGDLGGHPARMSRRDRLLLYPDQTLVVQMAPAVLQPHLRGGEIGVKVDADRVVANGHVKDQRERDEAESERQSNPISPDLYTTEQRLPR